MILMVDKTNKFLILIFGLVGTIAALITIFTNPSIDTPSKYFIINAISWAVLLIYVNLYFQKKKK